MELKAGDKVRAYLHDDGRTSTEITTQVLDTLNDQVKVEWPGHSSYGWWIWKDVNKPIEDCNGFGKVICKNVRRFKD